MTYEQILHAEAVMKKNVLSTLKGQKVNVKTPLFIKYGKYCKDLAQAYIYLKEAGLKVYLEKKAIYFEQFPALVMIEKWDSKGKSYFGFI